MSGRQGGMERSIVLVGKGEGGSPCPAGSSLSAHLPAARPRRLASLSGVTVPPGYTTARARALDREAAASGRPIASGGNGHAYRVWFNEFFRGRLSDPAFQTSEANLIEFIKARGRALDREQVSNGSLTHSPAISIPGNKAVTSGLRIASHLNGSPRYN